MSFGKLYGVGVGPGDKELVTLKALRILNESDVIMAPVMKNGEKTALNIVEEHIKGKKVIVRVDFNVFSIPTKSVKTMKNNETFFEFFKKMWLTSVYLFGKVFMENVG